MEKFVDWAITFIGYILSAVFIALLGAIVLGTLLVIVLGLWKLVLLLI